MKNLYKTIFFYFFISIPKILLANETCTVCLEKLSDIDNIESLCCMHRYHRVCILQWQKEKDTCPLCNKKIFFHRSLHILEDHDLCGNTPYIKIEITPHLYSLTQLVALKSKLIEIISLIVQQEIDKKLEAEIDCLAKRIKYLNINDESDDEDL